MNDEHDNAQTDKKMLRKFHADRAQLTRDLLAGRSEQELAETETIQAYIRSSMSDQEIVNEIIRVAGDERTNEITYMLQDRLTYIKLHNER